jgi:hypothetical protein
MEVINSSVRAASLTGAQAREYCCPTTQSVPAKLFRKEPMMKYFVLALLLSAGPVLAESWEQKKPDDIECRANVAGFTITYTYNSQHPPKAMPIEGLMCYQRDYEAVVAIAKENDANFNKYWKTVVDIKEKVDAR